MRVRRTNAELNCLKEAILRLSSQHRPLSVRQLFYLLVTSDFVDKTEQSYQQVIRLTGELRTRGEMPFGWIRDDSRRRMAMSLHTSPANAIREMAENYAFDYQSIQPVRLEIWCEKETLSGVLWPVCAKYRIDLLPCKGMPSLTYRHEAAMAANKDGRPFKVLYVGDSDPTGERIDPVINRFMEEYLKVEWLGIERVAVTDAQRESMNLFTRPAKETGVRAGRHADIGCVEVEAIPPEKLRTILADAIESNLDQDMLARAKLEDAAHRETIASMIMSLGGEQAAETDNDNSDSSDATDSQIILYKIAGTGGLMHVSERNDPLFRLFWDNEFSPLARGDSMNVDETYSLSVNDAEVLLATVIEKTPAIIKIVLQLP